jgi:hypothetical protein
LRAFVLNNTLYKTGYEGCIQQVPVVGGVSFVVIYGELELNG